jgi:hypothetical protein
MSPALKYWDATTSSWKLGAVGLPSGQVWQQVIGDGLNTSFTVTHGFGTRSVYVSVYRNSPPYEEVEADVERTDTSSVTVRTYPTVPGVSEFIAVVASAGTAATANITMDPWHTVGAAGEPAFQGSPLWSNLAGGYGPAGFRKYPDGRVRLRGIVKGGTIGSAASGIVFTLPVGYRPPTNTTTELAFATISFDAFGECRIRADGSVVAWAGNNSWFALEDIEFDTETVLQTASVAAQPLDTVHYVGAAGEPAFTNGWSAMSPQAPVFRKDPSGRVFLNGAVKSGTMQQAAFTLPVGYRPARELQMMVSAAASPGLLIIQTTGGVFPWTGSNSNVFLDGAAFDTETVAAYASGIIGPPRVTALPANPVDGQECYFVADAANGVLWHLRFNAGSSSAYKWEFVGGSPLVASIVGSGEAGSSTGAWSFPTTRVRVPTVLKGDYDTAVVLRATAAGGGSVLVSLGVALTSTGPTPPGTTTAFTVTANGAGSVVADARLTSTSVTDNFELVVAGAPSWTMTDRRISAVHVRVG